MPLWKRAGAFIIFASPWALAALAFRAWAGFGWILAILLGLAVAIVLMLAFSAVFMAYAMVQRR